MMRRPRVLLIEDNLDFRRLFEESMRGSFFTLTSDNGLDGFSRALSLNPDLIVLDIEMDGWSGIETLKHLRGHPKTSRIPVMMLSAEDDKVTALEALNYGADAYVLKSSFEREEVRERLLGLLPKATRIA